MRSIFIFAVLMSLFILPTLAQQMKGYIVNGRIKGLDSGTVRVVSSYDYSLIDSAIIKNGRFKLEASVTQPCAAIIIIDEIPYVTTFFLENTHYRIDMNADPFDCAISGGKLETLKAAFEEQVQGYYDGWYGMLRIKNDSSIKNNQANALVIEQIDSLCAFLQQNVIKRAEAFISKHPDSYVTPSIIMNTYRRKSDLSKLEDHYSRLAENIKNSNEGKELRKWITDLSKRKETGDLVENFNLKDTKGNMFQLKALLKNNKYVLIDFWATWCAPCIREFPYLKSAYDEFHSSGLEIIGISLDDNEDRFLEFLKKNHLPWKQFLDKNGKDVAIKGFNIQSIPANFLIDQNFKIIAYKLTGEDLANTLRKLLTSQPAKSTQSQSHY
jgi:peroxiredoxin